MKPPRKPKQHLFCTVKLMCNLNPIQATMVENKMTNNLLMTMISMAWGTESPIAICASAIVSDCQEH
jgi:hypothetical protein